VLLKNTDYFYFQRTSCYKIDLMNFIHFHPCNPVFDPRFAPCNLNPIHVYICWYLARKIWKNLIFDNSWDTVSLFRNCLTNLHVWQSFVTRWKELKGVYFCWNYLTTLILFSSINRYLMKMSQNLHVIIIMIHSSVCVIQYIVNGKMKVTSDF